MPTKESKHENFTRIGQARVKQVTEALRKVGNLASPNYDFTSTEVEGLFDSINEAVAKTRGLFEKRLDKSRTKANREAAKDLGVHDDNDPDAAIDEERYPVIEGA